VVVAVVADMLLNHRAALEGQVVAVAVAVIIIRFMLLFMDSTVNQPVITHIQVLIIQVVAVAEAAITAITHTALVVVVVLELLLLDTNRKNYERNTKN
jgi:hypothetical protein